MRTADQYERYMLDLINADRAKVGAPALRLEENLNVAAERHSEWVLSTDVFSHTGANGTSATQRMRDAGFDLSGSWATAENIGVQTERGASGIMDDVANLHTGLMNSPGHRANLLNPDLVYIGIGVELGYFNFGSGERESVMVTQNFARTMGDVDLDNGAASVANPPAGNDPVPVVTPTPVTAPTPAPLPVANNTNMTLLGTQAADTLTGQGGDDRLVGRGGNDRLDGGAGNDRLFGGAGADQMQGGLGNDILLGDAGNDRINGGAGNDYMLGGVGADTFVFNPTGDRDTIRDFQNNVDTLDLRSFGFDTLAEVFEGAQVNRSVLRLDFGNGDIVALVGMTEAQMLDDILI